MMAHAGGQPFAKGDWNRAIMAAQQLREPLSRNGQLNHRHKLLRRWLLLRLVRRRSSSVPTRPLLDPWVQLTKIRESSVSPEALRLICGGNIARLIGLS